VESAAAGDDGVIASSSWSGIHPLLVSLCVCLLLVGAVLAVALLTYQSTAVSAALAGLVSAAAGSRRRRRRPAGLAFGPPLHRPAAGGATRHSWAERLLRDRRDAPPPPAADAGVDVTIATGAAAQYIYISDERRYSTKLAH